MDDDQLATKLGALIRDLRESKGLSQEGLAHVCGLHRTYVGAIERGEKTMTITTAAKFARALGMSLSELFTSLESRTDGPPEAEGGLL